MTQLMTNVDLARTISMPLRRAGSGMVMRVFRTVRPDARRRTPYYRY